MATDSAPLYQETFTRMQWQLAQVPVDQLADVFKFLADRFHPSSFAFTSTGVDYAPNVWLSPVSVRRLKGSKWQTDEWVEDLTMPLG